MKGPIQSVEASYILHATEDEEKVRSALAKLLGVDVEPVLEELEGHYGNPVRMASVHLTGDEATAAFRSVVRGLSPAARADLVSSLSVRVDEHSSLFIRVDKQGLVSGIAALGDRDTVRLKVKPRGFVPKGAGAQHFAKLIGGN
ncbi:MAG: hypothetical protein HY247_03795 [archaeon]|nr:MAG: hypothetical protein HY247_03795 [archaeon]